MYFLLSCWQRIMTDRPIGEETRFVCEKIGISRILSKETMRARKAKATGEGKIKSLIPGTFLKDLNTCGKCKNEIRKRFIESQSLQLKLNMVRKVAFHI